MSAPKPELTVHICGPQSDTCKCNCPNGCEHKWDGPEYTSPDGTMSTTTCSRCGMHAISHDMWVMP